MISNTWAVLHVVEDELLQRTLGQLEGLSCHFSQTLVEVVVDVGGRDIETGVAKKEAPPNFKVGPHPLNGVQLGGSGRQEEQGDTKTLSELSGFLALVGCMIVEDDHSVPRIRAQALAADVFEELAEEEGVGFVSDVELHVHPVQTGDGADDSPRLPSLLVQPHKNRFIFRHPDSRPLLPEVR